MENEKVSPGGQTKTKGNRGFSQGEDRFSPWSPRWGLALGVVLPGLILAILYWLRINAINGQEQPLEGFPLWLFVAVAAMAVAATVYCLLVFIRGWEIKGPVWVAVSAFYSAWLTLVLTGLSEGFGQATSGPWMFICTLAMLPLFVSMLHLVLWVTPGDKSYSIGKTLLPMLAVPVLWYLIVNTLRYAYEGAGIVVVMMLCVVTTYGFLFILLRVLYLLWRKHGTVWKGTRAVILFVLPLLALMVTQLAPDFSFFWNFSSPLYYLLVVVNGVLLLIRQPGKRWQRLLLFFGRCVTYLFVTYFFIAISPFYTLSLLGMLIFGLGLLVLAPLFLWVYQTKTLVAEAAGLFRECGAIKTVAAAVAGILVIPLSMMASFQRDRGNFQKALTYLEGAPQVVGQDAGAVNIARLSHSMEYIQSETDSLRFNYMDRYQRRPPPPLISQAYTRVVGGREAVPYETLNGLAVAFQDRSGFSYGGGSEYYMGRDTDVKLTDLRVETTEHNGYYKSVLHLTLTNDTEEGNDWDEKGEYLTTFTLPEGVFISDYYLDVLDVRKKGLLAERSSALWIYREVVSRALDPGILYYSGGDVVFRVFPFGENEARHTGIELLHKGPETFQLDGWTVRLASEAGAVTEPVTSDNGAVYLSAATKEALPKLEREPRYAFVVDCSADAEIEGSIARLKYFCEQNKIASEQATVTALNYRRAVWPMTDPGWEDGLRAFAKEGGFAFELAAETICRQLDDPDTYPVLVAVTKYENDATMPRDMEYLSWRSPELDGIYLLTENGLGMKPFSPDVAYMELERRRLPETPDMRIAQAGGNAVYVRNDKQSQILLVEESGEPAPLSGASWDNALSLAGQYRRTNLLTGDERAAAQIELIKNSFRTGIMTPLTSYIVLETEEQEELMLLRQKKLLEGGSVEGDVNMDEVVDGENPQTSEPSLLLCLVLMIPLVYRLRRRGRGAR